MGREAVFDAAVGEVERTRSGPGGVLSRHGVAGDAEQLIAAVRASNPEALQTASAQNENEVETERLDLAEVREVAGAQIADAKVRGRESVVYSAYDRRGVIYKGTYELSRPSETHVSERSAFAESEIGQALADQDDAILRAEESGRQAALDQREADLARRERDLRLREESLNESGSHLVDPQTGLPVTAPAGADGTGDGANVERPAFLPADYDEQGAQDAAAYAKVLADEEKPALVAYERATKNRKTVLDALGADQEPDGD